MRLIFEREEIARASEITHLKHEVDAYRRMADHNHHICANVCEAAMVVKSRFSPVEGAPGSLAEAMNRLFKVAGDALGHAKQPVPSLNTKETANA